MWRIIGLLVAVSGIAAMAFGLKDTSTAICMAATMVVLIVVYSLSEGLRRSISEKVAVRGQLVLIIGLIATAIGFAVGAKPIVYAGIIVYSLSGLVLAAAPPRRSQGVDTPDESEPRTSGTTQDDATTPQSPSND